MKAHDQHAGNALAVVVFLDAQYSLSLLKWSQYGVSYNPSQFSSDVIGRQ